MPGIKQEKEKRNSESGSKNINPVLVVYNVVKII